MKKILFTDLDGTLLRDDKTVSPGNRAAIRQMLDQGNYVVVNTGRAVNSGAKIVKSLNLAGPGCYMIAFNGAVIYDCSADKILAERTIPIEYVEYLFAEAQKWGLHIQTYDDQYIITQHGGRELEYYVSRTNMTYKLVDNVFNNLKKEPNKALLIELDSKERLLNFQAEHSQWAKDKCSSFFSSEEYLEYCPLDTDKGSAIPFLCDLLNVALDDTYAVGDERNDIPMIQAAGVGIAMKNGHGDVKAAADVVTENDNEHDAIAEIIERYFI